MIITVVVAHPARQAWAERLASDLRALIVMDTEGKGAGSNHRAALRAGLATGADHILSIEDDALPIPDLLTHVTEAVRQRPDRIIGLYVGRQRPRAERVAEAVRRADEIGASWLTFPGLLWGVATVWPRRLAEAWLAEPEPLRAWDSHGVKPWCQAHGHTVSYTWPSLVDHQDQESLVVDRPRHPGRVAWRTGTPNWNDRVVEIR